MWSLRLPLEEAARWLWASCPAPLEQALPLPPPPPLLPACGALRNSQSQSTDVGLLVCNLESAPVEQSWKQQEELEWAEEAALSVSNPAANPLAPQQGLGACSEPDLVGLQVPSSMAVGRAGSASWELESNNN